MAVHHSGNRGETEPKTAFAPLEEEDLRQLTDPGSFSRGRSYFRNSSIFDPTLRGSTIRAQCHGSSGGPYIVEATLAPADQTDSPLIDWVCTCPRGGFCKHIVALLMTWIDTPDQFVARPELAALLTDKTRDELAAIVEQMVQRHPDLEPLIDLPLPGATLPPGTAGKQTVNLTSLRRQVNAAFQVDDPYAWGVTFSIADDLARIRQLGDDYAAAGQWANAQAVYALVSESTLDNYDMLHDEGEISSILADCCRGLARCLDAQAELPESDLLDSDTRAEIIEAIVDIWRFDLDYGFELANDGTDAIARAATEDERVTVEDWIRQAMNREEPYGQHRKRAAITFLMMLKEQAGTGDEELLEEYRAAELWDDVAALLLDLGRVDDAITTAARKVALPAPLTRFADQLIALGGDQARQALRLVEERLWEREGIEKAHDLALQEWLEQKYASRGMNREALQMALRRFETRPDHRVYAAVKEEETLPGQPASVWKETRPGLLSKLKEQQNWPALIEIHLAEGNAADALASLTEMERSRKATVGWGWGYDSSGYDERVAAAAEREFPDEAMRLYQRLATRSIEGRNRASYQRAAQYLARVKALYEAQGRNEDWRTYIRDFRETHKRLRALREELDALGLT